MAVRVGQPTDAPEPENPLTAGLERLPVAPTTLVIFGATGDLARRKLLPALYNLAHEGALPERFHLVGVSRKEKENEDYREECEEAIRRFSRRKPDEDVLKGLLENVKYVPGTFDEDSVYSELRSVLDELRERGRRAAQPRLLPVHRARVLPRDHRPARQRRARPARERRGSGDHREALRHHSGRGARAQPPACSGSSRRPRCSASTTTWARRRSRT